MADDFTNFRTGLESPPRRAFLVNPSDSVDMPASSRALNVGTTGDVRITTVFGDVVTLTIARGIPFPIRAKRVHATGTTAVKIVALY